MLQYWHQLQEKIDARVKRERVLIFLSAAAVLYLLWSLVIEGPYDIKIKAARAQIDALAQQRAAIQTQVNAISQAVLNDPDKTKKAQIEQLEKDIDGVEARIQASSRSLIKVDQLPQALQQVLEKTAQLSLLDVMTLPARELSLTPAVSVPNAATAASKADETSAGVYEHTVVLRVSGNYFQVLQFLTALEQLPWRFYWQRLDYKVTQYPDAEVTLRVYTLSSEEGLLGV